MLLFPFHRCLWGICEIRLAFCLLWCEPCVNGDVWKPCKEQCLLKPRLTMSVTFQQPLQMYFFMIRASSKALNLESFLWILEAQTRSVHRPSVTSVFSSLWWIVNTDFLMHWYIPFHLEFKYYTCEQVIQRMAPAEAQFRFLGQQ